MVPKVHAYFYFWDTLYIISIFHAQTALVALKLRYMYLYIFLNNLRIFYMCILLRILFYC